MADVRKETNPKSRGTMERQSVLHGEWRGREMVGRVLRFQFWAAGSTRLRREEVWNSVDGPGSAP